MVGSWTKSGREFQTVEVLQVVDGWQVYGVWFTSCLPSPVPLQNLWGRLVQVFLQAKRSYCFPTKNVNALKTKMCWSSLIVGPKCMLQ